jgi:hypothetical protein
MNKYANIYARLRVQRNRHWSVSVRWRSGTIIMLGYSKTQIKLKT